MKKRLPVLLVILALLLSACDLLPDAGEKPREISEQSVWAICGSTGTRTGAVWQS